MIREFSTENFIEIILLIVVLNGVIFLVAGLLHEAGHAIFGVMNGCENIRIVMLDVDTRSTYTMMNCPGGYEFSETGQFLMFFSSYIFVLPLSLLFLGLRGFRERYLGFIILGANILGSTFDLMLVYPS
ncbi:MAG: hypothetical protein ABEJ72_09340, partial [Candidatus Aenigmatarchaeota archaeon]